MNQQNAGYLNGTYGDLHQLNVSVMDRGFIFGDGCYEVVPIYNKRPFLLEEHLKRWFDNLDKLKIPLAQTSSAMSHIVSELMKRTSNDNEYLYLQATRGAYPKREHIFPKHTEATIFAYMTPFSPPTYESASAGIRAITRMDIRWSRCDIKSISLLGNVLLRQEALDQGADETILIRDGFVTEGSISNVFIVHSGIIQTPPLSNYILPGITRSMVIALAKEHGLTCHEEPIREAALRSADELWVTSSTREVVPVLTLDNKPFKTPLSESVWKMVFNAFVEKRS